MQRPVELIKSIIVRLRHVNKQVKICLDSNVAVSSIFEGNNYVGHESSFCGEMGFGSYIGNNSKISGKIGKFCSIAGNVSVVNGFHPTRDCVSTHPSFYNERNCSHLFFDSKVVYNEFRYAINGFDVEVGNDVWIGYGAIIIAGVKIGDGAVIAAGSVVTKNVDPYAIVGGVPAKLIRYRFAQDEIDFLEKIKWWDQDVEWLKENACKLASIQEFKQKYDEGELK